MSNIHFTIADERAQDRRGFCAKQCDCKNHTKTIVWTHQRPNKAIMANQRNNAKQTALQQTNFVDS